MIERVEILGGGQLGRMLTEASQGLGVEVTVLDPTPDCPAAQVGAKHILGNLYDPESIKRLARASQVITYEIEHINTEVLKGLEAEGTKIRPSALSLASIQDKLLQKRILQEERLPVAPFRSVDGRRDFNGSC